MTSSLEAAADTLNDFQISDPDAVRLARCASLAVRIEPGLLRHLRLKLLPQADVGTEADLWFSPLVESRGRNAIVLQAGVAELLRESLAVDKELLKKAISITAHVHQNLAPSIRLEERVNGMALLNEDSTLHEVNNALLPALQAMHESQKRSKEIARWFMRAAPRFHPLVLETENYHALLIGSSWILNRPLTRQSQSLRFVSMDKLAKSLPPWVLTDRIAIGVELLKRGIRFIEPYDETHQIYLPKTNPIFLELSWQSGNEQNELLVEPEIGHVVTIPDHILSLTLRTLSGEEYLLFAGTDELILGYAVPRVARPGEIFTIYSIIYAKGQEKEVNELFDKLYPRHEKSLGTQEVRWRPGTEITLRVSSKYLVLDPPEQKFIWTGNRNLLEFDAMVPSNAPQESALVKFVTIIEDIVVVRFTAKLKISTLDSEESIEPAQTAFASYTSADRLRVLDMIETLKITARLDIFMDCADLLPGEDWESALLEEMKKRDLFILIWTKNASVSKIITNEWKTALRMKGKGFIKIVLLEPEVSLPIELAECVVIHLPTTTKIKETDDSGTLPEAGEELQPVQLGASAPRQAKPGSEFTARFVAYEKKLEQETRDLLTKLSPSAETILGIQECHWKVGTGVTVRLSGGGMTIDPPEQSFIWNGGRSLLDFDVTVADDAGEDTVQLKFDVVIAGIIIARLRLELEITAKAKKKGQATATAEPARTAFASYSSKDRLRVLDRVDAIKISAGIDVFQDCLDLNPGEEWKTRLDNEIRQRDLFLLFWSKSASESKWVGWELETAIKEKGEQALQLHPLDPGVKAPPGLEKLNIGSVAMWVRKGYETVLAERKTV